MGKNESSDTVPTAQQPADGGAPSVIPRRFVSGLCLVCGWFVSGLWSNKCIRRMAGHARA